MLDVGCGDGVLLRLVPLALDAIEAQVSRQLTRIGPDDDLRREADALLVCATRDGVSEDGAIIVAARNRGVD